MSIPVRGLLYEGRQYVLLPDMILLFAKIGEMPNLKKSQRELVNHIIKDLREAEVENVQWDDE